MNVPVVGDRGQNTKLLEDAAGVWCSTYPRKVSGPMDNRKGWGQVWSRSFGDTIEKLEGVSGDGPGYVSVYSFPDGHTSDSKDNIPLVDTLMFDLDFDGGDDGSPQGWARDMSALLTRTRMVAQALIDLDREQYWRASLSGHKGVHLYLDFAPLPADNGTADQFRGGMRNYTNIVIDALVEETNLDSLREYIDVSSGKDLARLTRCPNTIHPKASNRFGEARYCVPVTISELAEITPMEYIRLTKNPREVPEDCHRVENQKAHDQLVKEIRLADDSGFQNSTRTISTFDRSKITEYEEQVNEKVTLDSVEFHLKRKPCIWAYRESGEMFSKGNQSHVMELNCIAAMMSLKAPIEVIMEFFEVAESYSEAYTRDKIEHLIAYQYSEFSCRKILEDAPDYCLKDGCNIYNLSSDLQQI